MAQQSQTAEFAGESLQAEALVRPAGPIRTSALFVHDAPAAASAIAAALARQGIAILPLRFDAKTGADPDELVRAARALQADGLPPSLLIGHAAGGTAAILTARQIGVAAVATINAPSATDRISAETVAEQAKALRTPLLILHAPLDQSVSVDHAARLFRAALHPKSFLSLDKADHNLSDPADADFTAAMLASWANRYLPMATESDTAADDARAVSVPGEPYAIGLTVGSHHLLSDAGREEGGSDLGPNPTRLMEAALAACSAMTVRMYARRKKWDLQSVDVRIRPGSGQTGHHLTEVEKRATFTGNLDTDQIARLEEILAKCPVHTMLSKGVNIVYRQDE